MSSLQICAALPNRHLFPFLSLPAYLVDKYRYKYTHKSLNKSLSNYKYKYKILSYNPFFYLQPHNHWQKKLLCICICICLQPTLSKFFGTLILILVKTKCLNSRENLNTGNLKRKKDRGSE